MLQRRRKSLILAREPTNFVHILSSFIRIHLYPSTHSIKYLFFSATFFTILSLKGKKALGGRKPGGGLLGAMGAAGAAGAAAGGEGTDAGHGILEGISSLHSWIKTQTMIRPHPKMGRGGKLAGLYDEV